MRAFTRLGPLVLHETLARVEPWEHFREVCSTSGGRLALHSSLIVSSLPLLWVYVLALDLKRKERETPQTRPTTDGCIGNFNAPLDCMILVKVILRL